MKKTIQSTLEFIFNAAMFLLRLPLDILFLLQNPQYILILIALLISVIISVASEVCLAISNATSNLFSKMCTPDHKASNLNTPRTPLNPGTSYELGSDERTGSPTENIAQKAGEQNQETSNTPEEFRTVSPA